jgi:ParB family chromosome partitioning protein
MSAPTGDWDNGLRETEQVRLAHIPLELLDHHPGNVRADYALTDAFCKSLAAEQQVAVHVVPIPDDHPREEGEEGYRFWVTKGNRRLAAARHQQLPDLLCLIDLAKAGDRAGQFIDMVVENDDEFRRGLTAFEQAQALFAAHEAGASRTRIRKLTGRTREEVAGAITAGRLSAQTRQAAQEMDYDWTLEDLALLQEFDGDEEALAEIHQRVGWGHKVRYAVEHVRTERAEAAERARVRAELEQAGIRVTDDIPPGALTLTRLADAVEGFDPDTHTSCGGHAVFLRHWGAATPVAYCASPERHGYAPPETPSAPAAPVVGSAAPAKAKDLQRTLVIEGNRAWKASATVRQEWVAALLARATAPKPVMAWVARQLMEMPTPLRDKLTGARHTAVWAKLAGNIDAASTAAVRPGRLPLLALAPIAVAYEHQMTVPDSARYIWRHDRTGAVSRPDARAYLSLLVELGYQPTPIEQAVIDGLPYRGDAPAEELEPEQAPDAGEPPHEPGAEATSTAVPQDADAWADPETDPDAGDGASYSAAA